MTDWAQEKKKKKERQSLGGSLHCIYLFLCFSLSVSKCVDMLLALNKQGVKKEDFTNLCCFYGCRYKQILRSLSVSLTV